MAYGAIAVILIVVGFAVGALSHKLVSDKLEERIVWKAKRYDEIQGDYDALTQFVTNLADLRIGAPEIEAQYLVTNLELDSEEALYKKRK